MLMWQHQKEVPKQIHSREEEECSSFVSECETFMDGFVYVTLVFTNPPISRKAERQGLCPTNQRKQKEASKH